MSECVRPSSTTMQTEAVVRTITRLTKSNVLIVTACASAATWYCLCSSVQELRAILLHICVCGLPGETARDKGTPTGVV